LTGRKRRNPRKKHKKESEIGQKVSEIIFFFFQALNFLVESFGLLNDPFHFPRSWTQAIQFSIFIWQISCVMLSSHLYLGLPCDLSVLSTNRKNDNVAFYLAMTSFGEK
jgi:hypothetical protein